MYVGNPAGGALDELASEAGLKVEESLRGGRRTSRLCNHQIRKRVLLYTP